MRHDELLRELRDHFQRRFPKSKFEVKPTSREWFLYVNKNKFLTATPENLRGWSPPGSAYGGVRADIGGGVKNKFKVALNLVKELLKGFPEWKAILKGSVLTDQQKDLLAAAVQVFQKAVKGTFPGIRQGYSLYSPGTGFYTDAYEKKVEGSFDPRKIATYRMNHLKREYRIQILDFVLDVKTIKGFITQLGNTPALIRKALKSVGPLERDFLLGKLDPSDLVKKVLKVEVSYETIDEWYDTSIYVDLMLRTKQKVPGEILVKWVKDNWYDIKKMIPKSTPPERELWGRSRSDEEEYGRYNPNAFIKPQNIILRDAEVEAPSFAENRRGRVEVRVSRR